MFRLDQVQARIEAAVPQLAGRIDRAAQFSVLIEQDETPPGDLFGYLLPGGMGGGVVRAATQLFIQDVTETVLFVLGLRLANPNAPGAADEALPIVNAVITGVCGWAPDGAPGVFALGRAELTGSKNGLLLYQIDFTLADQMRIMP